jgi:hypothetical protein
VLLLSTQLPLVACGNEPPQEPPGEAAGQAGAAGEAGAAGAGPLFCPPESDPAVHYKSKSLQGCAASTLVCGEEQRGFSNACGCGCIDKGPRRLPDGR